MDGLSKSIFGKSSFNTTPTEGALYVVYVNFIFLFFVIKKITAMMAIIGMAEQIAIMVFLRISSGV